MKTKTITNQHRFVRTIAVWTSLAVWLVVALCVVGVAQGETVEVPTAEHVDRLEAERDRQLGLLAGKLESLNDRLAALTPDSGDTSSPCWVSIADAEKWTGLATKPNDPSFDNGPAIQALFDLAGLNDGQINLQFYLPGGLWFHSTPLEPPTRTALALQGNGLSYDLPLGRYLRPANKPQGQAGGAPSILVYNGSPDRPAMTYAGFGLRLDGITFQYGMRTSRDSRRGATDGSVGLRIRSYDGGPPSGKAWIPSIGVTGFDTAIDTYRDPHQETGHADNVLVGKFVAYGVRTAFRSGDNQAHGWTFLHVSTGYNVDTVFDCTANANIYCQYLGLNAPALVARLGDVSSNNANLEIERLKVDAGAKGWRLLEQTKKSTCYVRVRGVVSNRAEPADNWLSLLSDNRGYHRAVDVRLRHNWRWLVYREGMPEGGL